MADNPYRDLPSVEQLASSLESNLPQPLVRDVARAAIDDARRRISEGDQADVASLAGAYLQRLERRSGISIINATGVMLHTNLGRARWSEPAIERSVQAARTSSNLELDSYTGERRRRGSYVVDLLHKLTGANDALVVNNNAGAVLLAVAATSSGRAVPVSRGELIEIGGSYRLPDVIAAGGARLVEVGTTNRTRIGDYETALQTHNCGCILKIHTSNYRVEGFTEEARLEELAQLAGAHGVPLVFDVGSGLLDADTPWREGPTPTWLRDEPAVQQSLDAGASLVTFSGDKLLGGPQAGVIVGNQDVVGRLRAHPMARALRVEGVTLAALAATLETYLDGDVEIIPFWRQALIPLDQLAPRAEAMAAALDGRVVQGASAIGAGSVPGMTIPSPMVVLEGQDHLYIPLLEQPTPILTRRVNGNLVIDLRTVDQENDREVIASVQRCR